MLASECKIFYKYLYTIIHITSSHIYVEMKDTQPMSLEEEKYKTEEYNHRKLPDNSPEQQVSD